MSYENLKSFKAAIKKTFDHYENDRIFVPSFFTNVKEQKLAWKEIWEARDKEEVLAKLSKLYEILIQKKSKRLALAVGLIIAKEKNIPEKLVRQYHLLRFQKMRDIPEEGLFFFESLTTKQPVDNAQQAAKRQEEKNKIDMAKKIVKGKCMSEFSFYSCNKPRKFKFEDMEINMQAEMSKEADIRAKKMEDLQSREKDLQSKVEQGEKSERKLLPREREELKQMPKRMEKVKSEPDRPARWFLSFFAGKDCRSSKRVEFSMGYVRGENANNPTAKFKTNCAWVVGCDKQWLIKIKDPILAANNDAERPLNREMGFVAR